MQAREAELQTSQANLERNQKLLRSRAVSQQEYENAELAVETAAIVDRRTREFSPDTEAALRDGERVEIEISGRRIDLIRMFAQGASFDVDGSIIVSDETFLRLFPKRRPGTPTIALLSTNENEPRQLAAIVADINRRFPESDVQDHLSEYATFKAIGYSPGFFLSIIFEEAISLATVGFVPGLLIALALYRLAADKMGLPISMPWTRPLLVFTLTA